MNFELMKEFITAHITMKVLNEYIDYKLIRNDEGGVSLCNPPNGNAIFAIENYPGHCIKIYIYYENDAERQWLIETAKNQNVDCIGGHKWIYMYLKFSSQLERDKHMEDLIANI